MIISLKLAFNLNCLFVLEICKSLFDAEADVDLISFSEREATSSLESLNSKVIKNRIIKLKIIQQFTTCC